MNYFCPPPAPSPCLQTGMSIVIQRFTVSGVYTPSPGLTTAMVECIGGGGGGGFAGPTPDATYVMCGGGGGSGGYSRKAVPAALVLGGVTVTVGAGGGSGLNGAATSFGALCVANGGGHGAANDRATGGGAGGPGATPGVGDLAFAGSDGLNGDFLSNPVSSEFYAAQGGIGGWILGGARTVNVAPGNVSGSESAWANSGAGGSGGVVNQILWSSVPPADLVNGSITGGTGGSGVCVVTEYCSAPPPVAGCGCGSGMINVPACPPGQWGFDG